jgi:hypothetical protein
MNAELRIATAIDTALIPRKWRWPTDFLHRDAIIEAQATLFRVFTLAPPDLREGFAATLQFVCGLLGDQVKLWEAILTLRTIEKIFMSRRGLI